ncbi:unnamed protein product [Mytilus coruscus]|uniref:Uncharacterized protein n=1 Tax=Mytilus coruscus TaxID=42192 RepID=A0A6J8A9B9_MYTCO|nr:unnamed protein product [Mytilus coruscus]
MKFRQISFKSFQKSKSKRTKTKEASFEQQSTPVDANDNLVTASDSYVDVAQDVSLRCSLRKYKTYVTPRNKYIITNRRTAISDDEEETDNGVLFELDDIDKVLKFSDVDIELNSPTIDELNERFANIDFKYEENIDNILDDEMAVKLAKRLSVNDLLEDYSEASSDTSNSSTEISDNTICTGSYSSEGSIENQLPVFSTKFLERPDQMEESIDAGYSSLSRDSRFPSTIDSDNAEHSDRDIVEESNMTLVDSACAECDSARTIPDIRNSLQDKVSQLRDEKLSLRKKSAKHKKTT